MSTIPLASPTPRRAVRRLALLAVLAALAAPRADAQIVPAIDVGFAGGVNFASLDDAGVPGFDEATGYHVGLFADISAFVFQGRTGVYYLRAGTAAGQSEAVSFVTVPVDLQLKTPTPVVQVYALAGPEFRFPLDGLDDAFDTRSVNTVLNVGLGVEAGVPLIGPNGFIELRYALDPSGLRDDGGEDYRVDVLLLRAGIGL